MDNIKCLECDDNVECELKKIKSGTQINNINGSDDNCDVCDDDKCATCMDELSCSDKRELYWNSYNNILEYAMNVMTLKPEYILSDNKKYGPIYILKIIRMIILEEQDNKCSICGQDNILNEKKLGLVLDYIDGKELNVNRYNLRCICPNCDSQLDIPRPSKRISTEPCKYK